MTGMTGALRLLAIASLLTLLNPPRAEAAWLSLCDGEQATSHGQTYSDPTGRQHTLLVSDAQLDDCARMELELLPDTVRWTALIPESTGKYLDAGMSLLGDRTDGRLRISEVIPVDPAAARGTSQVPSLLLGVDSLPQLQRQVFGASGRALSQRDDAGLQLDCRFGTDPAGLLLIARDYYVPAGARLQVALHYAADGEFVFASSNQEQLRRETPAVLGQLAPRGVLSTARFTLPVTPRPGEHGFSLVCPTNTARITLHRLVLEAAPAATPGPVPNSTWIWETEHWLADIDGLIDALRKANTETLFLAVPMTGESMRVNKPNKLGELIERVAAAGIETWAVEGDPAAVTVEGRKHFVERTQALAAFNRAQPRGRRFRGVQYDIEPYLMPGFDLNRTGWLQAYVDTIRELQGVWPAPLEVALPFWWAGLELHGRPVLDAILPFVDGVTVMNYRTDPAQIQQLAIPFLAWGTQHQRYIRIGLELGPLPDQTLWNFRPADKGRLWSLTLDERPVLLLLDEPAANPAGAAYALAYSIPVSASNTSFHQHPDLLYKLIPELQPQLAAWPAFYGIALHGQIEP
ncbi:MAG: hypothetical protein QNJ73_14045 [Gammaproteobacteria bacterium]|nr:hypothetical protein [Gammaproteobacteria bacterium]